MNIQWIMNRMPKTQDAWLPVMGEDEIKKVRAFHESFPQYERTPLVSLKHAAKQLGLGGLLIKDESKRFGLNAFKVLGGSFAIASEIAAALGRDIRETDYAYLTSDSLKAAAWRGPHASLTRRPWC